MNAETLAFDLLAEIYRRSGTIAVDAVDLVPCEDGVSAMLYAYHPGGECTPICFDLPQYFDPATLATALTSGAGPAH